MERAGSTSGMNLSIVEVLGADVFMFYCECGDRQVESFAGRDRIEPDFLQEAFFRAKHVLMGNPVCGIEASDVDPSVFRARHEHDREGDIAPLFRATLWSDCRKK